MTCEVYAAERDELLQRLGREFSGEARRAIAGRGFVAIALPGGSVAINCFPSLAVLPLTWPETHFFWVDERAVPASDPESNYALARDLWLERAGVPDGSIHRMPADRLDLTAAAAAYSEELTSVLGAAARMDIVLLGVGPDGHVASLFPKHHALTEERARVTVVLDSPKPPPRRLTLTLPALAEAERVIVVAFGDSKAEALREAIERDDSPLPLAKLLRRTKRPLVLADRAAARLLAH